MPFWSDYLKKPIVWVLYAVIFSLDMNDYDCCRIIILWGGRCCRCHQVPSRGAEDAKPHFESRVPNAICSRALPSGCPPPPSAPMRLTCGCHICGPPRDEAALRPCEPLRGALPRREIWRDVGWGALARVQAEPRRRRAGGCLDAPWCCSWWSIALGARLLTTR